MAASPSADATPASSCALDASVNHRTDVEASIAAARMAPESMTVPHQRGAVEMSVSHWRKPATSTSRPAPLSAKKNAAVRSAAEKRDA